MKKKLLLLPVVCSLLMSASLNAKSLDTVFVPLGPANCSEKASRAVSDMIRDKAGRIKNCDLASERSVTKSMERLGTSRYCYDRDCALRIAKDLNADRVIYGTVRLATKTFNRQLGREGAGKYLLQEKSVESYLITLYLIDVKKNTFIATVTETAGIAMKAEDAEKIIEKLQPFFMAPEDKERQLAAGKKRPIEPSGASKPSWDLFAGPSGFLPVGSLHAIARGGAGFIAGGGVSGLAFKNSILKIQIGYYNIFPNRTNIDSYHLIQLGLVIGYTFELPGGFTVSPVLGGGYIIHVVSEDISTLRLYGYYRYSDYRFYDPHLAVRCDAAWRFNEHYAVFFTPGYLVFFEKSSTGMAVDLTAGFRYSF
ncbi:MAG TPA: hypothetical protein PLC28_19210 [Spirochaetota bacterium]|nr:hypothetical protein [Spirochaetota bacterium]HPL18186.1 hypothetical protein [Spirochaetota bacterium]HQJ72844.1 hypothetical protein [Spirochaetota bacterium]HRS79582.1 hypothetical protein [Spirochaetota bacterium]HRT77299.1 hypothetical protein [Spirochaetota bacterium]